MKTSKCVGSSGFKGRESPPYWAVEVPSPGEFRAGPARRICGGRSHAVFSERAARRYPGFVALSIITSKRVSSNFVLKKPCVCYCVCSFSFKMATKTISVNLEAYDRLCQARSSAKESFSKVICRGEWKPKHGSAGDLLLKCRERESSSADLELLDETQEKDFPPLDLWKADPE